MTTRNFCFSFPCDWCNEQTQPESQIRAGGGSGGAGGAPVRMHRPVPPAPAAAALDTNSSRYCVNDNNGHFICPVTNGSPLLGAWFMPSPANASQEKGAVLGLWTTCSEHRYSTPFYGGRKTRIERASERALGLPGGEEGELWRGREWGGGGKLL